MMRHCSVNAENSGGGSGAINASVTGPDGAIGFAAQAQLPDDLIAGDGIPFLGVGPANRSAHAAVRATKKNLSARRGRAKVFKTKMTDAQGFDMVLRHIQPPPRPFQPGTLRLDS